MEGKTDVRASGFGMLWMVAAALLWSFIGVFGRYCLEAGMSPMLCAFMRAACGGGAFLLHCAVCRRLAVPFWHAAIFMLFGAWSVGFYFSVFQFAVKLSGAAVTIILEYTAPFWVALFARLFFKEEISARKLLAIVVASLGTVMVCVSVSGSASGTLSFWGVVAGLVSGFCYATYYPFTRRWQQSYSTATIFAWMMLGGALTLLCVLSFSSEPLRLSFSAPVWAVAVATGLACTYLAYFCYGKAIERTSLVGASICSELEPVLTVLWAWLAFGECFSPMGWLGSVLVIASVLFLALLGLTDK